MPTIQMKLLGKKGRFGNQLFQYAHLRQRAGKDYHCPPWIGQSVFGLDDPPIKAGVKDIGFKFPLHSSWYDKDLFRSLFVPNEKLQWKRRFRDWNNNVRLWGGTLIGIHLRRGDYGTFNRKSARWCFRAPSQWYLDWLERWESHSGKACLYIASDDLDAVLPDFTGKGRQVSYMKPKMGIQTYLYDFFVLAQCDILLTSNSTFSFAASMLNEKCGSFWRPRLSEEKLIPYDPWNSNLILKDELYEV